MEKKLTWLLAAAAVVAAIFFAGPLFRGEPDSPQGPPNGPTTRPGPVASPGVIGENAAIQSTSAQAPAGPLIAKAGVVRNGITGVVRDADGAPLDDVDVEFVQFDYRRDKVRIFEQAVRRSVVKFVTGADGAYTLVFPDGFELGSPGTLFAGKRGYLAQYKDWIKAGSQVDFTLRQGVPVVGRVLDEASGLPVAGAFVRGWYSTDGVRDADKAFRWQEDLRSNERGEFRFEGAPAGVVKFLAFHDEYYDFFVDRELTPGPENKVDLRVRKGIVVEGVVVDARGKKPVVGAEVVATAGIGMPRRFATTDEAGRFRAPGLEAGIVRFMVSKKGFGTQAFPQEIGPAVDFDPTKNNRITIEIQPSAQAAGIVKDRDGAPLAGAKIQVGQLKAVFWTVRDGPETTTDAAGRFLVGELLPETKYKIVASDDRCVIGLGEEFSAAPGEIRDGLEIRMPRGGGVGGRVIDQGGAPIAGVDVTLAKPPFLGMTLLPGQECGQKSLSTTRTDDQGRYAFEGLSKGDHAVTFDHRDYVLAEEKAVLREPDEVVTLDAKLVRGGDIGGSVFGADGNAAAKADVRAYAPFSSTAVSAATTDESGRYRLIRLRPGDYVVKATSEDKTAGAPAREAIKPGTEGVDFRMASFPTVTGLVVDQSARAVRKFSVSLVPVERRPEAGNGKRPAGVLSMRTASIDDEAGIFRIANVDPGRYLVDLKAAGFAPTRSAEIEVLSGADQDLGMMVVRSGGKVSGSALDDRGLPVPDVDVLLSRIGGGAVPPFDPVKSASGAAIDASFSGRTDAAGRYRIDAVAQGQYLIRFDSPRHTASAPAQINVMDGDETTHDARLMRSGAVSLLVRNTGSEPIPHCLVEVRDGEGRLIQAGKGTEKVARTGVDGSVKLVRLPIGPIKIVVGPPGYVKTETVINVIEGEDRAVTLTVQHEIR